MCLSDIQTELSVESWIYGKITVRDVNLDALAYRCYFKLWDWSNHVGYKYSQRRKQLQTVPALRGQEEAEDPAKEIKKR